MSDARHCDSYIDDPREPMALRWFLFVHRLPAAHKALCFENGVKPILYATYNGHPVRVLTASALGDVGITYDLGQEMGYKLRVNVEDLCNFSSSPSKARSKIL